MLRRNEPHTYLGKCEYKYVYVLKTIETATQRKSYRVKLNRKDILEMDRTRTFHSAKEAALYVDKTLIKYGYEPVNILCKK